MMGIFELIYYAGYRVKTARDLRRQRKLPVRVISIGNITTGGTGKTPAAIALAMEARARGYKPCVLTRGYRGNLRGPVIVTPGMDAVQAGDEPLLMAEKLDGIPVVKGADRYEAGTYALENLSPPPDLFILDDGFQHRRLLRDVDILLINAVDPFDNMRLLPMGYLREPLDRMKRADAIVLTKSAGVDTGELEKLIRKYNSKAPMFPAGHSPSSLRTQDGIGRPLDELAGRAVFAFSGIAGPEGFVHMLLGEGADVRGSMAFGDHHAFTQKDIAKIERSARQKGVEWIITTEKDIMRLKGFRLPENLMILGIEFTVDSGFYDFVLKI